MRSPPISNNEPVEAPEYRFSTIATTISASASQAAHAAAATVNAVTGSTRTGQARNRTGYTVIETDSFFDSNIQDNGRVTGNETDAFRNTDNSLEYRTENSQSVVSNTQGVVAAQNHLEAPSGTVLSSSINIVNTILGAGMLAMPSAIAAVGLGFGVFLIALSSIASSLGLYLLSRVAAQVGRKSSFFACAKITYPDAAVWIDFAIAVKCFGVSISYLVICGDLLPQVSQGLSNNSLPNDHYLLSKFFWTTASIFLIAPFAFLRQLNSLRYTSAFALTAVVYLLFVVIWFYISPPKTSMPFPPPTFDEIEWIKISSKLFTALPVFVFAFTCHQNIFSVYNELIDNSPRKIESVIKGSILTSVGVYQTIGIIGYLTFGNKVTSNIIAMYPNGILVTYGQLAIALLVLLSYPLQCHPARASLDKVFGPKKGNGHTMTTIAAVTGPNQSITSQPTQSSPLKMSGCRFTIITLCLLVGSYIVAVSVTSLSTVLAFVGATGSTTIGHILPGIFYYRMRRNANPPDAPLERLEIAALCLASFGGCIMVSSLTTQLLQGVSATGGH
ncbi:hypothetical protein QVD99_002025 [Batrachochytrium dendrobatidis]|nr:hypothetical protein O5D80_000667 [Batrachochytrium dendrobatidis]KAK5672225.1 hypothetical protein QVD99_002025 [Batrachochytrium dendrobatidis]